MACVDGICRESGGSEEKEKSKVDASDLAAAAAAGAAPAAAPCDLATETCPASATAGAQPATEDGPDKKKKNRCAVCKKKVGLTGFGCRCGGLFCAMHRYSDKHDCSFDYRTHGAEEIRKNNPVVKAEKVKQI